MARHLLSEVQGAITWAEWPGGKPGHEEVWGGILGRGVVGMTLGGCSGRRARCGVPLHPPPGRGKEAVV